MFENSNVPHTKIFASVWYPTHSLSVFETKRAGPVIQVFEIHRDCDFDVKINQGACFRERVFDSNVRSFGE